MKTRVMILFVCLLGFPSFAQFVIQAEGIHPENACVPNSVYFLVENKAKLLEKMDSIEVRVNKAVHSMKQYPSLQSKPSVQFVVNCRNELGGGFHMVVKSGKDSVDTELIGFFKTVKKWKAGSLENKPVDSWYMWKLEIKKGYITIVNQ